MGRSDLIHPESPAPNCSGALQTGFSEQSRAWFPSRNSSPPLGLHDRKWQGAISYIVRSWEPHQLRAPHLWRFPCRLLLLLFLSTLPFGIHGRTRNSVSGWQSPACEKQTMFTGSPPKATLGIPAALKGSMPGYHALLPKSWGKTEREGTLGGELCVSKEESVVHLSFTQESGPCPGYRAHTESQFHRDSTERVRVNTTPIRSFLSFLRQIFSSEPLQNSCFWKPPFQLLTWITKDLTALLRVIMETTRSWHFSFYALDISPMNILPRFSAFYKTQTCWVQ